jgi:hypothetical protein
VTPRLLVDCAPASCQGRTDPGVVHVRTEPADVVAVFEGWGSWGSGMDAAAEALRLTAERWTNAAPASIHAAAADVHAIAASVTGTKADAFDDRAFSGVIIWVAAETVQVAAAGTLAAALIGPASAKFLFKPRMLLDQVLEQHPLTSEQIRDFPHRHVCLGPFLASPDDPTPLTITGPHGVPAGGAVLVAEHRLVEHLLAPGAPWDPTRTAAELQRRQVALGMPPFPVVVIEAKTHTQDRLR